LLDKNKNQIADGTSLTSLDNAAEINNDGFVDSFSPTEYATK
jgi:hypothetical protein